MILIGVDCGIQVGVLGKVTELRARLSPCQSTRNSQSFLVNDNTLNCIAATVAQPGWNVREDLVITHVTDSL